MTHIFSFAAALLLLSCTLEVSSNQPLESHETQENNRVETTEITSSKSYTLGNTQVMLTQTKSDGLEFYCKSKLVTSHAGSLIDSISFTPEPVGGSYGISRPERIGNNLIFTKHGDYDGRTIIVNEQGKISSVAGGACFYDPSSNLLFSLYDSDLNGLSVFDLSKQSTALEMTGIDISPYSFHKDFGERYFILGRESEIDTPQTTVLEIEFDLERIVYVELYPEQMNDSNAIQPLTLNQVNCHCEE